MPAFSAEQHARTDDELRAAQRLAWEKQFPEAERRYREILRREPRLRAAALGLGQVLLWEQRYGDAAAVYRDILEDASHDVDARKGLATAEYWSGDFRGARRDYAIVLRGRPNDAEARKALADIAAASAPLLTSDNELMSDDQPLRRARAAIGYTFFSDPLTKWTATAGGYALDARSFGSENAPFVSLAGTTSLPASRLRLSGSLRLLRFPDGETKPLGGFTLAREWRHASLSLDVDRHELLYTVSSLRAHPYETASALVWKSTTDDAESAVALRSTRYFDSNSGRGADAYHLMRVARGSRASLSLGGAFSYRDTDETRFRLLSTSTARYDPYWTPRDLREVRGIVAATCSLGRAAVHLHVDAGLAREEVSRTFHPWRASADMSFPLRGAFVATLGAEHQRTAFYRANSIHFGFSGRL